MAFAALLSTFIERDRIDSLVQRGRDRVSQMMLLDEVVWEEVGTSNLSPRVTKELLLATTGLKAGQEMLRIDLDAIERKLEGIPFIESVQIQKKLPSTIHVRYTVHQARAFGLHRGRLWLVSASGKWISPIESEASLDLPVLATEESTDVELAWLDAFETELGASLAAIHEVNYSPEKAKLTALLELQYSSQPLKATVFAAGRPSADALARLKRVVQYLIKNNILVSTIDLRPGKKVVVNVGRSP